MQGSLFGGAKPVKDGRRPKRPFSRSITLDRWKDLVEQDQYVRLRSASEVPLDGCIYLRGTGDRDEIFNRIQYPKRPGRTLTKRQFLGLGSEERRAFLNQVYCYLKTRDRIGELIDEYLGQGRIYIHLEDLDKEYEALPDLDWCDDWLRLYKPWSPLVPEYDPGEVLFVNGNLRVVKKNGRFILQSLRTWGKPELSDNWIVASGGYFDTFEEAKRWAAI